MSKPTPAQKVARIMRGVDYAVHVLKECGL